MRKLTSLVVATLALALPLTTVPAQAAPKEGTRSLVTVLTSDRNHFDRSWDDFDITTEAVRAVLKAKPDSAVGVLAQGRTRLTAFVPTDRAFRRLYQDLTGDVVRSERRLFGLLVRTLGVDTIEGVLLYHVVPGATITRRQALRSDGASLTTAAGSAVTVDVYERGRRYVRLLDLDPDDRNGRIVAFDLNKGNRQIAHAVNRVLRPANL